MESRKTTPSNRQGISQTQVTATGEGQPQPTCDTRIRSRWKRTAVIASLALAATSCTSESPDRSNSDSCGSVRTSQEGELVQQLLGTSEYKTTTFNTDSDLSEKLSEKLQAQKPDGTTSTVQACAFSPKIRKTSGGETLHVEFSWTPRASPEKWGRAADGASYYNLNDVPGESDETLSRLRVECNLPGELNESSKQAILQAESSNTAYTGDKADKNVRDRQITFLYFMTRKATEALGCENNPLKEDPAVKAYSTPEEAAQAGNQSG
ncbi:hypothetical protein ACIQ7D_22345 [Streptomyces sp. NPDC096310]|uniref:hypothetical protein n=1 Tax=Streptomyces sp. NPDC096310 TaxID=3366082 RepID=UPI0037FF4AAB